MKDTHILESINGGIYKNSERNKKVRGYLQTKSREEEISQTSKKK